MDEKLYDLMDWAAIEAVVYSEESSPENILGPHKVKDGILVMTFLPDAQSVQLKLKSSGRRFEMECADEAGVFAALLPIKKFCSYTFIAKYDDGSKIEFEDPYLYTDIIGESDVKSFDDGVCRDAYNFLGAHPIAVDGCMDSADVRWDVTEKTDAKKKKDTIYGAHFAVWAPNAMRVSIVGDFNFWDGRRHQMCRVGDSGVFSLFVPGISPGDIYKYEIKSGPQKVFLKTDPYGFECERRPDGASVVADLKSYKWEDAKWIKERKGKDLKAEPVSIYEVHLGSWRKKEASDGDGEPGGGFLNYREIAPLLSDYVKELGYTHVELMPVMEHSMDESMGYQASGYFAATSRYGSPQDLMYFMDYMHQKNIGVILDWPCAHFPKDANGLAKFDGSCLYENPDPRRGCHPNLDALMFDCGKPQVDVFLISSALFWIEKYHADGLRMDDLSSMLFLDYGRADGEWVPNIYAGRENLEAAALLKEIGRQVHARKDGAVVIAQEQAAWPKVTWDADDGGLGFDFKWNTGWMNDFITYMQTDPLFRKGRHDELLFSMVYAYSESFMLVFPHDEVVGLKGSMLMKMPGDMPHKFANLRAAYGFMMAHPGKKQIFMGQEFEQRGEWNVAQSMPWIEARESGHAEVREYVKALNRFYMKHPALYKGDYDESGFEWLSSLDAEHSIVTFMRRTPDRSEQLLFLFNFTPVVYENFKVGVPFEGKYKEIFNSDALEFGGSGIVNKRQKNSQPVSWDGRENSITVQTPPLGMCVFNCVGKEK